MADGSTDAWGEEPLPEARPDVVFRQLTDEWVLYDPDRKLLHVLNATSAAVWHACDGETPRSVLADEILELFDQVPERAQVIEDIEEAIERFATEGLLS